MRHEVVMKVSFVLSSVVFAFSASCAEARAVCRGCLSKDRARCIRKKSDRLKVRRYDGAGRRSYSRSQSRGCHER